MTNNKNAKNAINFNCSNCNFSCSKKSDFDRHTSTRKHEIRTNTNKYELINAEKTPIHNKSYPCHCGKFFKHASSLWNHKQKCRITEDSIDNNISNDSTVTKQNNSDMVDTMMHLIKQNQEFKEIIIELTKKDTTINNNTINNNNNQKFNLNFFLNDTCKDAMNMSEFIEDIEVQFEDIENIGRNGYVTGMTEMILSRIKNLDITKRPVHCTDLKRETMYIKDNNEWERDTPDNKKLQKMISMIAKQNYATIPLWRNEHPESEDMNNPMYNFNIDILRNVLGDVGDGQTKLDKKVIKNLSKYITVEKPL